MVDAPQPDDKHDQSASDLQNVGAAPEAANTAKPNNKQHQPEQDRDYSQYVMRLLKAIGRVMVRVVNRIDEKGPFVTALATVVIAILTAFYVHYSRAQWQTMNQTYCEIKTQTTAVQITANAAANQTKLLRQQLIGSQAATIRFVNGSPILQETGELYWYFVNEGHVSAGDVTFTLSTKYLGIDGRPISNQTEKVFEKTVDIIPPTSHPDTDISTFYNPIFDTSSHDWQRFRETKLAAKVTGTIRYNNGFMEREQPICYYVLAYEFPAYGDNKAYARSTIEQCDAMPFATALSVVLRDKATQLGSLNQQKK